MENENTFLKLVGNLSDVYVTYELNLRLINFDSLTLSGKKYRLAELLRMEKTAGVNTSAYKCSIPCDQDIEVCAAQLVLLNEAFFSPDGTTHLDAIHTKIRFLISRINRISDADPRVLATKNTVLTGLRELSERVINVTAPLPSVDELCSNFQNASIDIHNSTIRTNSTMNTNPFLSSEPQHATQQQSQPQSTPPVAPPRNSNLPIPNRIPQPETQPLPQIQSENSSSIFSTGLFRPRNDFYSRPRELIWKWNLCYTGDNPEVSASEFLQVLLDRSTSRNVTCEELLHSMTDLLGGTALRWFRSKSILNPFRNWNDFCEKFLKDFEPSHQSDMLLEFIRSRVQLPNESVVKYFAEIEDLFLKLPYVPQESLRVKIIRKNILPEYIHSLALFSFDSVEQLRDSCKRLECGRAMVASHQGSSNTNNVPSSSRQYNQMPNTQQQRYYSEPDDNRRSYRQFQDSSNFNNYYKNLNNNYNRYEPTRNFQRPPHNQNARNPPSNSHQTQIQSNSQTNNSRPFQHSSARNTFNRQQPNAGNRQVNFNVNEIAFANDQNQPQQVQETTELNHCPQVDSSTQPQCQYKLFTQTSSVLLNAPPASGNGAENVVHGPNTFFTNHGPNTPTLLSSNPSNSQP